MNFLKDVLQIGALTIIASFVFFIVYGRIIKTKKRNGTLSPKNLIKYTSCEMMVELQRCGYKGYGLGKIESFLALDSCIEKKKASYTSEELLNDRDLIMHLGSFAGELLRLNKHYKWEISEEMVPKLVRNEETVYPFELVKQKINGELESLYDYVQKL